MNTEEMNLALAKWMGWRWTTWAKTQIRVYGPLGEPANWSGQDKSDNSMVWNVGKGKTPEQEAREFILRVSPDYCNDLNAIRTVEEKLTEEQFGPYVFELMLIVGVNYSSAYERRMTSATAAQKAEALVRALGLEGK